MEFKAPRAKVVVRGSAAEETGRAPTTRRVSRMPKNVASLVEEPISRGETSSAFRILSTILSGRYKPERALYEVIWKRMLSAPDAEATQCYEMLKLLQAAFPAGAVAEEERGWWPLSNAVEQEPNQEQSDFLVLLQCLRVTMPAHISDEDDEDKDDVAPPVPQSRKRGALQSALGQPRKKAPPSESAAAPAAQSAYGHGLLLQFMVMLLVEDARSLQPADYKRSAVFQMLMGGGADTTRWQEVAKMVVEAVGSLALTWELSGQNLCTEFDGGLLQRRLEEDPSYHEILDDVTLPTANSMVPSLLCRHCRTCSTHYTIRSAQYPVHSTRDTLHAILLHCTPFLAACCGMCGAHALCLSLFARAGLIFDEIDLCVSDHIRRVVLCAAALAGGCVWPPCVGPSGKFCVHMAHEARRTPPGGERGFQRLSRRVPAGSLLQYFTHYTTLTTLHYATLHYITLYFTTILYNTLHYTTLH
jgi:hypothetical protein